MRILMLGNSFTAAYKLTKQLSQSLHAEVEAHTRSGARLAEQINPETKMGARTQEVLNNESWDYVVLQEMSKGPVVNKERYFDSVKTLSKQIKEHGATPIIYVTWAYKKGSPAMEKEDFTYEEMHERMQEACLQVAKENDCLVANIGEVFYTSKKDLYDEDGMHPNELGVEKIVEVLTNTIQENEKAK